MEKIDLNKRVGEWAWGNKNLKAQVIDRLCYYGMAYRRAGIQPYGDTHTIRQLCQEDCYSIIQDIPGLKYIEVASIIIALNKDGLSIEMTDEELAEYEGKSSPKPDTIDWEQRRWELVRDLWELNYDTSTPATCVEQADELIEQYKESIEDNNEREMSNCNDEKGKLIPQMKRMIREAYIGKHYTHELRMYKEKYTETTEFDVRHLVFGRTEVFLFGEYDMPFGPLSLSYEDILGLADNGYMTTSWVQDVKHIYKLE